jgi:hypothetical protein
VTREPAHSAPDGDGEVRVTQSVQTRCRRMSEHRFGGLAHPCSDCYSVRATSERIPYEPEVRWHPMTPTEPTRDQGDPLRPFFCANTGSLTEGEKAIHRRYQSDDPDGDYFDPEPTRDQGAGGGLEEVDALIDAAMRAACDPGSIVKRGRDNEGDYESLYAWQRRAMREALAPTVARLVSEAEEREAKGT